MIHLPASVRVYLCLSPCDMRRSFDGLAFLARQVIQPCGTDRPAPASGAAAADSVRATASKVSASMRT